MADQFDATIERATAAQERLGASILAFRSSAANDLKAVEAMGSRIRAETAKVTAALETITNLMARPETVSAIACAERLAAALSAIESVKDTRLMFAVVENQKGDPNGNTR